MKILKSLVAVGLSAVAFLPACKPGGNSSASSRSVFSLPSGNYRFVRGTLKRGTESVDVFAKGGTGKVLAVVAGSGGSFVLTDKGKYEWAVGTQGSVGLDCTLKEKQDVWTFSVYSVEGGVGKLSGGDTYTPGCSVDKEPKAGVPLRLQWKALQLTPLEGGEFELQQEATFDGKKHLLVEVFRKEPSP